jgi:PAS domain S-box-containing protein
MKITTKIYLTFITTGSAIAIIMAFGSKIEPFLFLKIALAVIIPLGGAHLLSRTIFSEFSRWEEDIEAAKAGSLRRYKPSLASNEEIARVYSMVDDVVMDLREKTLRLMSLEDELKDTTGRLRDAKGGEEHFRKLFENANDALFIYRTDGMIVDVNQKACDMMGYNKDDLLQMSFLGLHTDEELQKEREARIVAAGIQAIRFESEFKRGDGTVILVEISSNAIDRKRGLMQAIVTNITGRKELEKALKESEEKFRTFMETASDLMYIADRDGNFSYVNAAMLNSLGYVQGEMRGMNLTVIMDKDTKEVYRKNRFEFSRKGDITYEPVWEAKNRRKVFGEMKETAIYDSDGIFSGSRGVFRDTSERKKIQKAQRLAQLGELAADVAHEVNNPVMVILGRAELLLMDIQDEKLRENLRIIIDQCERAKDMVQRLLKFSKPSKGDFRETEVNSAIENTVKLVEPQFLSSGVKLIRKYGADLPLVRMDEKLMQEVFMNLLRNAQEAMTKGGSIKISTYVEDGHIRMDFRDTGSGISEENIKNIFDPFFTTKEHGTGLGLSVCYGIVKAHGGELRYSSEPGNGTMATVVLPLTSQEHDS